MDSSPLTSPAKSPPSSRLAITDVEGSLKVEDMPDDLSDLSDLSELSDLESESTMPFTESTARGVARETPRVIGHSPVGKSIARPQSKATIKVYGRNRTTLSSPKFPVASTSRISPPSSPSTIIVPSSPSKRKRQSGLSSPSTPSKRPKGSNASLRKNGKAFQTNEDNVVLLPSSPSPSKRGRPARKAIRERDDNSSPSPTGKRSILEKTDSMNDDTNGVFFSSGHKPSSSLSRKNPQQNEVWSLDRLKDFVWVRVNESNALFEEDTQLGDYFWWPSKVVRKESPLSVDLFCPPSQNLPSTVDVQHPSQANILPQLGNLGQIRFTSSTFHSNSNLSSPRKLPSKILERWQEGLEKMLEEEAITNDGFPTSISALHILTKQSSAHLPSQNAKPAISTERAPSPPPTSQISFDRDAWSPPPVDENLSIPGEPVFAKDKRKSREYWPAEILEYIPPLHSGQKPKFKVRFFDLKILDITRDMFHAQDEEAFATCIVGTYRTYVSMNFNDSDQDDAELQKFAVDLSSRIFPEPNISASDKHSFFSLPMDEQFVHVIPVLDRIIENRYPPASERHNMFLKGGKSRSSLSQAAGAHGTLSKLEIDKLLACIILWLQRRSSDAQPAVSSPQHHFMDLRPDPKTHEVNGDAPQPNGISQKPSGPLTEEISMENALCQTPPLDCSKAEEGRVTVPSAVEAHTTKTGTAKDADEDIVGGDKMTTNANAEGIQMNSPLQTTRQLGFEDLKAQELVDYASNVLLPEAIFQLLLWRNGERRSLQPLTDEEENSLHDKGFELAHKVDILKSIERLREMKRKALKIKDATTLLQSAPISALGRTRSGRRIA